MYRGPWIFVHKPQETKEREDKNMPPVTLIHDNESARALGFKGGFVGGLDLLNVASGSIIASFGHTWFEGGTLSVQHRAPVYEGELEVAWEEISPGAGESRRISYHLENHEGEKSCQGWAAVPGAGRKPLPPWLRNPLQHVSAGEDVLPEMKVGDARAPFPIVVRLKDIIPKLDAIREHSWWYRYASPWGSPVLCPYDICFALYQGLPQHPANPLRSTRLRTSMDAGTDLIVYQPLFAERTYYMKAHLADKWQTDRTVFFVTHYDYTDEHGNLVAMMRAYTAHLIRALAPVKP